MLGLIDYNRSKLCHVEQCYRLVAKRGISIPVIIYPIDYWIELSSLLPKAGTNKQTQHK